MNQSTTSNSWVTLQTRIHFIKKYVLDKKFELISFSLAETEYEDIYAIMINNTIKRSELLRKIQGQIRQLIQPDEMKLKACFDKKDDETFNPFDVVVFHFQKFHSDDSDEDFTEHYEKLGKRLLKEKQIIKNIKIIIVWSHDEIKASTENLIETMPSIHIPGSYIYCDIIGILHIDASSLYRKSTKLPNDQKSTLIDALMKAKRSLLEREEIRIQKSGEIEDEVDEEIEEIGPTKKAKFEDEIQSLEDDKQSMEDTIEELDHQNQALKYNNKVLNEQKNELENALKKEKENYKKYALTVNTLLKTNAGSQQVPLTNPTGQEDEDNLNADKP